ncbi:purine nucleoside permease [Spirosoma flavum]|uniref:Purine nucleoside permease n=1 Tax=Spirosoma flavum TaxID=2048557 RepID=A0ABW6ACH1_9BACT
MKKSIAIILLLLASVPVYAQSPKPIPVRVVIITMFEIGADTGDRPGEFQYWVERLPLAQTIPFPQGYRNLRYNPEKQVLGICTGMGTARSAASIMALGMDPRFDLSHAYWLVAGIAGIDPQDGSAGSAAWAEWLVDGDLAHEIDSREIPKDWSTGYLPLRRTKPYEEPAQDNDFTVSIHLNSGLVNWAYALTKDIRLDDTETLRKMRAGYSDYPKAQEPPRVMMGDHLAAMTFWHGKYLNDWANQWVKYWTQGKGNFVTSAMEDTGTGQSLQWLSAAGKANVNRYLVLRTASNYTMQPSGVTAAENLTNGGKAIGERYTAYIPALEAAYKTGIVVVDQLINNWKVYKNKTPADK